jgi:hypothetical protein
MAERVFLSVAEVTALHYQHRRIGGIDPFRNLPQVYYVDSPFIRFHSYV